jgi:hypothetical protein
VVEIQAASRLCFVSGVQNPIGLHLNFCETLSVEVSVDFTSSARQGQRSAGRRPNLPRLLYPRILRLECLSR